jgi:hypothetical protein
MRLIHKLANHSLHYITDPNQPNGLTTPTAHVAWWIGPCTVSAGFCECSLVQITRNITRIAQVPSLSFSCMPAVATVVKPHCGWGVDRPISTGRYRYGSTSKRQFDRLLRLQSSTALLFYFGSRAASAHERPSVCPGLEQLWLRQIDQCWCKWRWTQKRMARLSAI